MGEQGCQLWVTVCVGGGGSAHRSPSARKQKSTAVVYIQWLSLFMCVVCLEVFVYLCPRIGGGVGPAPAGCHGNLISESQVGTSHVPTQSPVHQPGAACWAGLYVLGRTHPSLEAHPGRFSRPSPS